MNYKVVFEIEVEAESPLDAAKEVQEMLNEHNNWQYYIQSSEGSEDVFSVDLQEEDEDAVLKVDKYIPMIK
jgi:hypothetical protein